MLSERTRSLPWGFDRLYADQERAIRRFAPVRADRPQSTLILSGTGSGKTECVLMPIVDARIRRPDPGVKAVIVHPITRLPTTSSSA
jgi:DEAD/DEAH box helicase domain-containing protein